MTPRIELLTEKKLIGKKLEMSYANNKTPELWRSFMPRRNEISNNIGTELFSLQVFETSHFDNFNPNKNFEKWALIEVSNFDIVPTDMETFVLKSGLYAVFFYKGLNTDTSIFQYIFTSWLPNSKYSLDERPHFEILGEKYKNNDPSSEEEIWIPIKLKE
ncbi:GyrI-like domain-containing protein [Emticicia sp. SJ17W-69]|uniref:GyrI-like domain-containing protein n=1 Tax=Emticicia sp. SJ17W-69 TaxID=3421657 RepID=UPI003EB6E785